MSNQFKAAYQTQLRRLAQDPDIVVEIADYNTGMISASTNNGTVLINVDISERK